MSVCRNLKGYVRRHERMADLFSLTAVLLLFGSLTVGALYNAPLLDWMKSDVVLHVPLVIAVLLLDVALIFFCLDIGSARFGEEEQGERCFHTFRGRRAGSGSLGMMFNSWLHHIEQVGRKHR